VLSLYKPRGVFILGIEQSKYSESVVDEFAIPRETVPHPVSYGLTNAKLTEAWNALQLQRNR
jgi:hypothetical protein